MNLALRTRVSKWLNCTRASKHASIDSLKQGDLVLVQYIHLLRKIITFIAVMLQGQGI